MSCGATVPGRSCWPRSRDWPRPSLCFGCDEVGGRCALAGIWPAALVAVLALSAAPVSTPPVNGACSRTLHQPRGPVLPLGTLAGQIGVAVAASDGQLVVRVSATRGGDYYGPQHDRHYAPSGRLGRTRGDDEALTFGGWGTGCFVASAAWLTATIC
jgi:hypothetical protein